MSRSRLWLVSALCALVSFGLLFAMVNAWSDSHPEIRIVRTGDHFSALVITEHSRLLIINSDDRGETRSAIGNLARPWEPDPTTVVAPADDGAAIGLWEALRHPAFNHVIIAGVPGSDPIWSRIEAESRTRGLEVTYVPVPSTVDVAELKIEIEPAGVTTGAAIVIRRSETVFMLNLTGTLSNRQAHIAVGGRLPDDDFLKADLVVAPSDVVSTIGGRSVVVEHQEIVRFILESQTIRVRGGTLIETESVAN